MRTMAMGEFYVWYCEWCDSRNLTPWTSTVGGTVYCGCCKKEFPVNGHQCSERIPQLRQAFF
ncbi:hypothetical protein GMLC_26050 [Geomonas limicola]|uniref:GATA-type domain-containing protein n=1 Tax=Geomonas limicola TaxID=2740186 RepID=A0A6V8N8X3_9BACT|nr:hypothetical protein [Geomonas limicola]GFO69026.1 hypothetical protein GMLC_26050 [Geomonas limicola]